MYTNLNLNFLKLMLLGLVLTFATSCDKDDDVAPTISIADLVGTWQAASFVHTNKADAGQSFDVIANEGEIRFTLLDHGGVRTWVEFGTFSDEWDAKVTISGNTLTSVPIEAGRESSTSTFVLKGDVLTLTDSDNSFDFTLMDQPEVPTTSVGEFERK